MSAMNAKPLAHQVVRASAGAGKTYQLTTRYLQLLSRGEPAQNTLATTFTRKAAGEVLSRVLGRLAKACQDEGERKQLAQALDTPGLSRGDCTGMLRTLCDGLNRLSVGTIDGFFSRAARAMAFELGLPSDPRMIDEDAPLAKQLRADAIHAVLGEQAAQDGGMTTLIEILRRLHHDTAQRSVTEAIDSIVKALNETYRAHRDRALWDTLPTTGLLPGELIQTAIAALDEMAEDLPLTKTGTLNKVFSNAYDTILQSARAGHWDTLLATGLVKKILEGEDTFAKVQLSADWQAALKPLIWHGKAVRLKALSDQTLATYDLLALFDEQYTAMRYNQRVLLFSDLTNLLADGLPNMGEAGIDELCYRLDARVTHLLLDEFQDTSLRQWEVLKPFAEQIAATSDGSRSLFCVGDTKQAIYGWRGGCAELFDEVESLHGVEKETLSKSWRSSQIVLDTVNQVFGSLAGNPALDKCERAAADWQAGFETHAAQQTDLPGHVVLHTTATDIDTNRSAETDADDDDETAPPDAHAHFVAHYIRDLNAKQPGRSVGVLMRSRAKGRRLMHALRTLGVYAAEEGGNPIDNMPSVSAVLSAIQLADHPGDSVARFHVMNTPVAAVIGIDQAEGAANIDAVARRVRRSLMDHGYAAVIADWVRELAPSCDARSLRRLLQLVELAEDFDQHDAGLRPSFFVESARSAKVEDPSPALVRVMTIHASKGLEFDSVVLPDLDSVLTGQDSRSLVVLNRDSPVAPVRGVFRRLSSGEQSLLPELEEAHAQQAYEKRTEDLCLLYVAMTRAKRGLHMLVRPLKEQQQKGKDGGKIGNGKPTKPGYANLSYAAVLRQALCETPGEGEDFAGNDCLYESGHAGWAVDGDVLAQPTSQSEAVSLVPPIHLAKASASHARSWVQTTPSQMHNAGSVSASDLLRRSPAGGRDYGTLIHALFEQVGFIDESAPDDEQIDRVALANHAETFDPAAAVGQFRRALDRPDIQGLLSREGADELWRERSFVARLGERLVKGTFDRVHLWRQDGEVTRAVLIDFKTDRVDDQAIDKVVSRYADQIGLYAQALSAMLGIQRDAISAKLCFVGDGRVVDVV